MNRRALAAVGFLLWTTAPAAADVLRVTDLTTAQIRALDRSKTLVVLSGGMLEEHGPYLPAYTDGVLSDRLTQELTRAVATERSGWTVLLFPQIPFGASGYNEIGGHYVFPGTYAVRPSTLRAVFMDLASELGEQGFRWIAVVHVHGSPLHIRAIDQAGDFFRDTRHCSYRYLYLCLRRMDRGRLQGERTAARNLFPAIEPDFDFACQLHR